MRADEELSGRVLDAERRMLRAAGVQAAEREKERASQEGRGEAPGVCPPGGGDRGEREDSVMGDDMRAIDDAEALRVWSELSELDPKIRGDTYVSEDGSQWNFSDLVDDLRVMRERRQKSREEEREAGRGAASGGGVLVSPEVRQREEVPMEVGATRKRAAEAEADDGERASREETGESASREMRSLSLLLAEGATVLYGGSKALEHEDYLDGRGCLYLTSLDTAVEEPEAVVEWNRPRAECFYDEYTGIELP
eukprot:5992850-Amphidinium_carterae.1